MSLIDNVRQTLTDVTETVVERGQQVSNIARLQLAIKKLQLERARRLHELGVRAYDWYRAGTLSVGGQVPGEVTDLCRQVADLQRQLADMERELEEAKRQAEEKGEDPNPPAALMGSSTAGDPGATSTTASTGAPSATSSDSTGATASTGAMPTAGNVAPPAAANSSGAATVRLPEDAPADSTSGSVPGV